MTYETRPDLQRAQVEQPARAVSEWELERAVVAARLSDPTHPGICVDAGAVGRLMRRTPTGIFTNSSIPPLHSLHALRERPREGEDESVRRLGRDAVLHQSMAQPKHGGSYGVLHKAFV
jgi:hypothetical protein